MNAPTLLETRRLDADSRLLGAYLPVPGFGVLPINSFLIRAAQPVLIDTGLAALREDFMRALRAEIDPRELRWIWLTHTDADHTGSLEAVLAEAPHARLVTSFIGMAKLSLVGGPVERAYLLNPGQRLNVGDRELLAVRPPTYDAPETTGLFDTRSRNFYSADSFGALLPAPAEDAAAIAPEVLRDGMVTWATIDAPWLGLVDEQRFRSGLDAVRKLAPERLLSSHLPPSRGMTDALFSLVDSARGAPAFVGPDQAALEKMMRPAQAA